MYKEINNKVVLARNDQKLVVVSDLNNTDIFSIEEGFQATKELVATHGVLTVTSSSGESVKVSHQSPNWHDVMLIVYPHLSQKVWRSYAFKLYIQYLDKEDK